MPEEPLEFETRQVAMPSAATAVPFESAVSQAADGQVAQPSAVVDVVAPSVVEEVAIESNESQAADSQVAQPSAVIDNTDQYSPGPCGVEPQVQPAAVVDYPGMCSDAPSGVQCQVAAPSAEASIDNATHELHDVHSRAGSLLALANQVAVPSVLEHGQVAVPSAGKDADTCDIHLQAIEAKNFGFGVQNDLKQALMSTGEWQNMGEAGSATADHWEDLYVATLALTELLDSCQGSSSLDVAEQLGLRTSEVGRCCASAKAHLADLAQPTMPAVLPDSGQAGRIRRKRRGKKNHGTLQH